MEHRLFKWKKSILLNLGSLSQSTVKSQRGEERDGTRHISPMLFQMCTHRIGIIRTWEAGWAWEERHSVWKTFIFLTWRVKREESCCARSMPLSWTLFLCQELIAYSQSAQKRCGDVWKEGKLLFTQPVSPSSQSSAQLKPRVVLLLWLREPPATDGTCLAMHWLVLTRLPFGQMRQLMPRRHGSESWYVENS